MTLPTSFSFLAKIPPSLAGVLVWLIYILAYPFTSKERRIIKGNIQKVYNLPPGSSFAGDFVRQNLMAVTRIMLDTIRFAFFPDTYEIVGLDEARDIFASVPKGCGAVIITAHLGSWDLAGYAARQTFGREFYALAKPSKSKWLTPMLGDLRERLSMRVLWTDSKSLLRDMMAVAQNGDALGFVMDQRPGKRQGGHPCTFLGIPGTHIVPGPALMATRKNLPVFGVYVLRIGPSKFRFCVTSILPPSHGESDEGKVAQLMADDMSRMIMLYPEQWSWNYRRWK